MIRVIGVGLRRCGMLGVGCWWLWSLILTGCGREKGVDPITPEVGRVGNTNWTLAQVTALAISWDKGWLGPERAAQQYDQELSRFWDRTRGVKDPWDEMLGYLPSGSGGPKVGKVERSGEYVVGELLPDEGESGSGTLRERMLGWRESGWRVVQSEWRTVGFSMKEEKPVSEVRMTLHLELSGMGKRMAVQGEFLVDWEHRSGAAGVEVVPGRVRWLRGGWVGSDRRPRFQEVFRAELDPVASARFVGPVLFADLKGIGRDEVLLAGANRILGWDADRGWEMRPLLGVEALLMGSTVMDADRDGSLDLVSASSAALLTFRGDGNGGFVLPPIVTGAEEVVEPMVVAQVDWDRDGWMDVWVGQYLSPGETPTPLDDADDGYPSSFWKNNGGGFTRKTDETGLGWKGRRRVLSGVFLDLDGDGISDLVRVCDYAGLDVLRGGRDGRFEPVTAAWFRENRGFGMSHGIADLDGDGRPDLVMTGMTSPTAMRMKKLGIEHPDFPGMSRRREEMTYGNRVWLNRGNARWEEPAWGLEMVDTGWTWGCAWVDPDNSGEASWYVANGFMSAPSSRDAEGEFWCFDAYMEAGRSGAWMQFMSGKREEMAGELRSLGGHHRNMLISRVGGHRRDVAWLEGVAAPEDCFNVAAWDYDGDGRQDLVVLGQVPGSADRALLRVYRNEGEAGNWLRVRVPSRGGREPWGGRVELAMADGGRRHGWLLDQQGFQVQPPPEVHFGLGTRERVDFVEVTWPDGTRRRVENPGINRVLEVRVP